MKKKYGFIIRENTWDYEHDIIIYKIGRNFDKLKYLTNRMNQTARKQTRDRFFRYYYLEKYVNIGE